MLQHRSLHSIKPLTKSSSSLNWRTQIEQYQLVSQISSILLQRTNWVSLFQTLNLTSKLTPSLFLQILQKTHQNPQICLSFFNWAKANLGFEPDVKSHSLIIKILLRYSLFQPARPIIDYMIQSHSPSLLVDSLIQSCRNCDSQSSILSFVLQSYSTKDLFVEGIDVFRKMRMNGWMPSIQACNSLLDCLVRKNEIKLAWCCYGAVLRDGVLEDRVTWSLVAQILCKNGKFETVVRMLEVGLCSSVAYNLVIDWYSKTGDFEAAFGHLSEMLDREFDPGFGSYSSVLDGACKHKNDEVVERIMGIMVEKRLLQNSPLSEYDSIVQKLADMGKTYAAEMFMDRAFDEKIGLKDATYGCILRALSKEGRINKAIGHYHTISERGITVNSSSYLAFADTLCREDELEEQTELLTDVMNRGFIPSATELSNFITSKCRKRRWKEAENMLKVIIEKGLLLDSSCCCSLMKHYCVTRQIDKAIGLHNEMEKVKGNLDTATYNIFLDWIFKRKRIDEAIKVFDYMRRKSLVNSASFTIMIKGLCQAKEMKTAMKIHDEMLEMKLKPDKAMYKRLISGFN